MDAGIYIIQNVFVLGENDWKFNISIFQRGFMDPLDKILSVIVMNAIVIVSQDSEVPEETRR